MALIYYNTIESLSEHDNKERFHREVSVLWSLSFHPSIVKLLAYSDEPRTIFTRKYMMSLPSLLAGPGSLSWEQRLNFAMDVAAAVSAVHSLVVAHRNVQTASVLIDKDVHGKMVAVLAGFGHCRVSCALFLVVLYPVLTVPPGLTNIMCPL